MSTTGNLGRSLTSFGVSNFDGEGGEGGERRAKKRKSEKGRKKKKVEIKKKKF